MKRKFDMIEQDICWGDESNEYDIHSEGKKVILLDEHFVYRVGNEIHFATGVNKTSIQALIKTIMEYIMEHKNKALGDPEKLDIVIIIDSPGGSINALFKFIDTLQLCREKFKFVTFTSVINGMAASAATIMAICCDKRYMTKHATAMVHELSSGFASKYQEINSYCKHLKDVHEKLANIYVQKTRLSRDEIEKIMRNETWYTSEEYLQLGFVDEIK